MAPRRPLRGIVDFTQRFARLPVPVVFGLLVVSAGLVARVWGSVGAGIGFGLFALGDGVMLIKLPQFGRSFGPPQLPWLSLMVLRLAPTLVVGTAPQWYSVAALGLLQAGLSITAAYACWVEPARLDVSEVTIRSPRLNGCPPLRVLQISDLHIERVTRREQQLLALVKELMPDVIVVTGDYLNISYTFDTTARRQARELLRHLDAPGGVFAITGSPAVDPPAVVAQILEGLDITWLRDRVAWLEWHHRRLRIVGVECSYDVDSDERKVRQVLDDRDCDYFTMLLYHTPDVMPAAVAAGVDLYLAGHTHGGQLRLPFFGALVTASNHGKKYEMGMYRDGSTILYVNRGMGMEGAGAPRARFLCPPELTLFTLRGAED